MLALSKHFYIFIYIFASLQGISILIANQIYIFKTSDVRYKKLQNFNFAFFININLIYLYKDFAFSWDIRYVILFAINASYVAFIYLSVQMLQEFSGMRALHERKFLITSGIIYIIIYTLTYEAAFETAKKDIWNLPTILVIISNITLIGVVAAYYIRFNWPDNKDIMRSKLLFNLFGCGITAYSLFNFCSDFFYCYSFGKNVVWKINAYNLTILLYIFINCISWVLFYQRKVFINTIMDQNKDGNEEDSNFSSRSTVTAIAEKYRLTEREKEVLELLCLGKSNPDISNALFISIYTAKHHVNNIFRKMDVKGRYELLSRIKNP